MNASSVDYLNLQTERFLVEETKIEFENNFSLSLISPHNNKNQKNQTKNASSPDF
jgi:hypothetical protein